MRERRSQKSKNRELFLSLRKKRRERVKVVMKAELRGKFERKKK